jgi:hypothetical protein
LCGSWCLFACPLLPTIVLLGGLTRAIAGEVLGNLSCLLGGFTRLLSSLSGTLACLSNCIACATTGVLDRGARALCELMDDLGIERLGKSSRDCAEPTIKCIPIGVPCVVTQRMA